MEVLLDESVDRRNTALRDSQRDDDWRSCKLIGWATLPAVSAVLSRLLKFNVWYEYADVVFSYVCLNPGRRISCSVITTVLQLFAHVFLSGM